MNRDEQLSNNQLFSKLLQSIESGNEKVKVELKKHIDSENEKLIDIIRDQNKKISELEQKCEKLTTNYLVLDRKSRKNNIIVYGLECDSNVDGARSAIGKLNSLLGTNLCESDLNNIFSLHNTSKSAVKIEFISYLKKNSVFQNISKLKGTDVFISHDLCYEDRLNYKILAKHMKEARERNLPAKIVNHKLVVNGKAYTANELEEGSESQVNIQVSNKRGRESYSAPSTPSQPPPITDSSETEDTEDKIESALNTTVKPQLKKQKQQNIIPESERRTRQNSSSTKPKNSD